MFANSNNASALICAEEMPLTCRYSLKKSHRKYIRFIHTRDYTGHQKSERGRRILKPCIPNELIPAIGIEISKDQIDKIAENTLNNCIY